MVTVGLLTNLHHQVLYCSVVVPSVPVGLLTNLHHQVLYCSVVMPLVTVGLLTNLHHQVILVILGLYIDIIVSVFPLVVMVITGLLMVMVTCPKSLKLFLLPRRKFLSQTGCKSYNINCLLCTMYVYSGRHWHACVHSHIPSHTG